MDRELPKIISVDDHVIEPPHVFQEWLPQRFREQGPRVERRHTAGETHMGGGAFRPQWADDGTPVDCWVFEGRIVTVHRRNQAAVGFPRDEMGAQVVTYDEMRQGCYDPKARLADMDVNWVEGSLCFPTMPRFCGQTFTEAKDHDLGLACVRAYNDWMVEEWCGDSGGRLIPLIIVPLWDAELAAAEVRRNAERGVRAVTFCEIPPNLGLPSIHSDHWDPFISACAETQTVINMHVGSSSKMPATGPDAPPAVTLTLTFNNAMASLTDWLFSGKLVEFPSLRLAYSEGQIGWLPYVLNRADDVWDQHRAWAGVRDIVPERPSSYYHQSVYGCFFRDTHGIASLDAIGEDRVTFETDYPHTDSTWPDTKSVAEEMFAGLDDDVVYKIVRGNAIEMLGLDFDREGAPAG
jgi:predicted TIM-barrel fold metal-dependent hydrolase